MLTVTPLVASSAPKPWRNRACQPWQQSSWSGLPGPFSPFTLLMLMMRPQPFSTMSATTCLVTLNMLFRLVSITASQSLAGHLQEHAVAGDTSVVHQHINGAMPSLGLGECPDGRIPVAHVAHRCVKGEAQGFCSASHLAWSRGATAGDDLETILCKRWQIAVPMPPMPPVTYATFASCYFSSCK